MVIFKAVSNAKAQSLVPGLQGSTEGDTLETLLDALRRLAVSNNVPYTLTEADSKKALTGGTWAVPELRNNFYTNLKELNNGITDLKGVSGTQYTIQSLTTLPQVFVESTAKVNDDLGKAYRYALKNLNPFAVFVVIFTQFARLIWQHLSSVGNCGKSVNN